MVGTLGNDHDRPARVVDEGPRDPTAAAHHDAVGPPILGNDLQPVRGIAAVVDQFPPDTRAVEVGRGGPAQLRDELGRRLGRGGHADRRPVGRAPERLDVHENEQRPLAPREPSRPRGGVQRPVGPVDPGDDDGKAVLAGLGIATLRRHLWILEPLPHKDIAPIGGNHRHTSVTAQVGIGPAAEDFGLAVTLTIDIPDVERKVAEKLAAAAHRARAGISAPATRPATASRYPYPTTPGQGSVIVGLGWSGWGFRAV
jgi:hypothetical protein